MALLAKLARRKPVDLLLALEALAWLSLFRVALKLIPVRRIIPAVCKGPAQAGPAALLSPPPAARDLAIRVRWALESVTRNSPAQFVCFPQSLAAYMMLRTRGVPATIVYGVARAADGALIAHTWLTVGDRMVVGGDGSEAFSPIERWH